MDGEIIHLGGLLLTQIRVFIGVLGASTRMVCRHWWPGSIRWRFFTLEPHFACW